MRAGILLLSTALASPLARAEQILNFNNHTRSCVAHSDSSWGYYGQLSTHKGEQRQEILLPNDWGQHYAACGRSLAPLHRQSPIELPAVASLPEGTGEEIRFAGDGDAAVVVEHNCHTVQATLALGTIRTMALGRQEYRLLQFHIHTPSEHVIAGKDGTSNYPAELHFVHAAVAEDGMVDSNRLAVVGVFVDIEDDAAVPSTEEFFGRMLSDYAGLGTDSETRISVNLDNLIRSGGRYWRYQGSLTTPPCSETVEWVVAESPLVISTSTYRALQAAKLDVGFANSRPPQLPTAYHKLRQAAR
jgi:carbonic anhydrase